jgi:hypothetical protein
MVECQITIVESELQLSLDSLYFSFWPTMIFHQTLAASIRHRIQIFIQDGINKLPLQAKLVVSNHHSKCLSKGKITMMEICSKSDVDPFCRQPLNGDLISSLCEITIWIFQLVLIKHLNHALYSRGKMRGWCLSLP